MKRAFVTGATGFCGRALVQALKTDGTEVVTFATRDRVPSVETIRLALIDAQPDVVFHLAGVMSGASTFSFYSANVMWAAALFDALDAARLESRVLVVGSAAEYGPVDASALPVIESLPPAPVGLYGLSKLAQTSLAIDRARSRRVVVARPSNILGPGMPSFFALSSFALQLAAVERGRQPPVLDVGNLDSGRDFIDVRDVVRLYRLLVDNPAAHGAVVNVCSGTAMTVRAALDALIRSFGVSVEVRVDPMRYRAGDVSVFTGSTARLAALAGPIELQPFSDTINTLVTHARASYT